MLILLSFLLACGAPAEPAPVPAAPAAAPSSPVAPPLWSVRVSVGAGPAERTIVAVHGLGDAPENFAGAFRGYTAPARLVLPRGPHAQHQGWSWMTASRHDEAAYAEDVRAAAGRIAALIATLDGPRPVITGFSQGGILSFAVAVLHPESVSLAVPVSGWLPRPLWPEARREGVAYPPIRAQHGDADTVLPLEPTRAGVEHLRALGLDAELTVYEGVGHQIPPQMRDDWYANLRR